MRLGGFNGFSFREIAEEVGVKSSSVHYHFPTKEALASAVIRRYTEVSASELDAAFAEDPNPQRAWTRAFRENLGKPGRICPCIPLGAAVTDLPEPVAEEAGKFYKMCLGKLENQGLEPARASEFLSTLLGALVLSKALGDPAPYDLSVSALSNGI